MGIKRPKRAAANNLRTLCISRSAECSRLFFLSVVSYKKIVQNISHALQNLPLQQRQHYHMA